MLLYPLHIVSINQLFSYMGLSGSSRIIRCLMNFFGRKWPDSCLFCILYGFLVYKDELRKKLNSLFSELKTSGAKLATNIFCTVVNMSFNLVSHQPSMKLYLVRFGQCKIVFRLIHTSFESNIIHHCSVKQNQSLFTEVTHPKFVSRLLT